ncbi:MAG: CHAD domain-containing protein [Pseudomonadota bacterium]
MKPTSLSSDPGPVKATPLNLCARDHVGAAFGAILADCLAQMRGNAIGAAHSDEPEYIHQMRVGLRRLKSALRLFGAQLPAPPALADELDWLAATLGQVRDWEVLSGDTVTSLTRLCPGETGLINLRAATGKIARQHRQAVAKALALPRFSGLIHTLETWGEQLQEQGAQPGEHDLQYLADKSLRHAFNAIKRRSKHAANASQRHRIRIAAKRLRYAIEFFAGLYAPRKIRRFAKEVTRLQQTLGELNDAAVAQELLRDLARRKPDLANSAGFARGALAARAEQQLSQLAPRLRQLRRARAPFAC